MSKFASIELGEMLADVPVKWKGDIYPFPQAGVEHSLKREATREGQRGSNGKSKFSYPKLQLLRGLRYKVGNIDPSSRDHDQRLFKDAYYGLLHGGAYLQDRRWARRIEKVRERMEEVLDWERVAELEQPNVLSIPLAGLGKEILPKGRKIMRLHDPFMEVFFDNDAYLLRQIASAVRGGDPDKMRVWFASKPAKYSINPSTEISIPMQPFTPDKSDLAGLSPFDKLSLKNGDVKHLYEQVEMGMRWANDCSTFNPTLLFAEVCTGGGRGISFEFVPDKLLGQMATKVGHRQVRYSENYYTSGGSLRSRLVVRDETFELPEEFAGINFPTGRIDVSWIGKRRVVKNNRDHLMKDLMQRYHSGELGRPNAHHRNGKSH